MRVINYIARTPKGSPLYTSPDLDLAVRFADEQSLIVPGVQVYRADYRESLVYEPEGQERAA